MTLFKNLFRRKGDKFLILLANQAELTLKGLELLEEYFRTCDQEKPKR